MYLVGFRDTGFIMFNPKSKKTINSCNVKIDENLLYKHDYPSKEQQTALSFSIATEIGENCIEIGGQTMTSESESQEDSIDFPNCTNSVSLNNCFIPSCINWSFFDTQIKNFDEIPITFQEAMTGVNREEWEYAINTELQAMKKHNVWTVVPS